MTRASEQKIQSDLHNRLAGQIVASIAKPPLEAGGTVIDVLVLLESVVAGVLVVAVRTGGDNIVLDAVIDGVRDRAKQILAEQRLGPVETAGRA
jgi:hypothetical protein